MRILQMLTAKRSLIRIILVRTFAFLLILIGLVMFPTPIPFGTIFFFIGLAILITESKTTRNFLRHRRKLNPKIDHWLRQTSAKIPKSLKKFFDLTDPNTNS